jgi:hypothetical protein
MGDERWKKKRDGIDKKLDIDRFEYFLLRYWILTEIGCMYECVLISCWDNFY